MDKGTQKVTSEEFNCQSDIEKLHAEINDLRRRNAYLEEILEAARSVTQMHYKYYPELPKRVFSSDFDRKSFNNLEDSIRLFDENEQAV